MFWHACDPLQDSSTLFPYTTLFRSNAETLDVTMVLDEGGNVKELTATPPPSSERVPVSNSNRQGIVDPLTDRKSTRLNSSHVANSYAVVCLKKKSPSTRQLI